MADPVGQKSLNSLLWLVAVGFFMQTLDSTIVDTALPAMARSLGESPLRMQSVVIAYALTMAILIPASGWIADRFGTRWVFFTAIAVFTVGSQLCAMASTLPQLVLARVAQAVGGSMLLPVGRLALLRSYPRAGFLEAMSFVSIPGLIGPLIGPTLGGWLVDYASWHWIFLINIPIGVAGCTATLLWMPDSRPPKLNRFDLIGYVLLAASMAAISFALDGLAELGLRHATVLLLLILGLASFAAYWLRAARIQTPLFSPHLFRTLSYSVGLIGNLFARIGSGTMPFLIPLLLQLCLGYTPFRAGMMMIPIALSGMAAKRLVRPLIARFGYKNVLVVNTFLVGLTMASFALIAPAQPMWLHILQLLSFGAVNSLQFTAMNTCTLKDLSLEDTSSGNGLLSVVQMLAMSLGVAAAGALLAIFARSEGGTTLVFGPANLPTFHHTFISVGLITMASAAIFWQLPPDTETGGPVKAPTEHLEVG